ncbi:DNA-directed RNA polymerase subunit beta [Aquibacillus halophilus]|uniref:DNA-directed RNA polymerase subunit beta n=1 Tax=Aquibacillus halophilus TaxID=930132 RepID=A0A6A8DE31_9BACI|nr:DNA-directed RNA polymerase subunit beta [Aquibacillus halophilus]MRH43945.1 DNA-directed RNA polymerase subunit beta [Aquibacillus halophilus]
MLTILAEKTEENKSSVKRKEQKNLQKQEKKLAKQNEKSNGNDKDNRKKRREEKRKNKVPIRRLIPIWLKVIIVLVLSFAALIAGLMVGYGILGDGNPTEALNFETWKHIVEIVTGE